MTNLEMLKTATPEQIRDIWFCGEYREGCDACPGFLFDRCESGKKWFLEWLNREAKTPKNAQSDTPSDAPSVRKGWKKLKEELCNEIGGCDKCPPSIFKHCKEAVKAMEDWKKPQEPKDAPRGWIKLKAITNADDNALYIKASIIAGVWRSVNVDTIDGKTVTAVCTLYAEDDPWLVYDSIDEVMGKIEKAYS